MNKLAFLFFKEEDHIEKKRNRTLINAVLLLFLPFLLKIDASTKQIGTFPLPQNDSALFFGHAFHHKRMFLLTDELWPHCQVIFLTVHLQPGSLIITSMECRSSCLMTTSINFPEHPAATFH